MLRETGGAYAFAKLLSKKIDTPAKGQILTSVQPSHSATQNLA